jgi:hypothetical protein
VAVCEATFGARLIGLAWARLSVLAITAVAVIAIPRCRLSTLQVTQRKPRL